MGPPRASCDRYYGIGSRDENFILIKRSFTPVVMAIRRHMKLILIQNASTGTTDGNHDDQLSQR